MEQGAKKCAGLPQHWRTGDQEGTRGFTENERKAEVMPHSEQRWLQYVSVHCYQPWKGRTHLSFHTAASLQCKPIYLHGLYAFPRVSLLFTPNFPRGVKISSWTEAFREMHLNGVHVSHIACKKHYAQCLRHNSTWCICVYRLSKS